MKEQLSIIKYCDSCLCMVPVNSLECEICDDGEGNVIQRKLTNEEFDIPCKDLIKSINNAYFLLEEYKTGKIKNYKSYDFLKAFKVLFINAQNTLENHKLIGFYWTLNQQINFDFQQRTFNNMAAYWNPYFNLDCVAIQEITDTLEPCFVRFTNIEIWNNPFNKLSILDIDKSANILYKERALNAIDEKSIQFQSEDIIERVFSDLKAFFPNKQPELLQALNGKALSAPILFTRRQNQLAEYFKRLWDHGKMASTKTEIADWLCKNFEFIYSKGNIKAIKLFNKSSVWDVLSKNKGIPAKGSKIGISEWLPYK